MTTSLVAPSRREQILDAVLARLAAICVADGFATDAGAAVMLGEAALGPDDPKEAIVVVVEDDQVTHQGAGLLIQMPLTIQAIVWCSAISGLGQAYRRAEAILSDIKRAMELPDRVIVTEDFPRGVVGWKGLERGVTSTLKKEPGSELIGVTVQYGFPYQENWGNP